jgi:NAD-dependent DNA ligase
VVGEGAGSKVETAQQLGVKMISEEDLRLMIGDFPIENTEEL